MQSEENSMHSKCHSPDDAFKMSQSDDAFKMSQLPF